MSKNQGTLNKPDAEVLAHANTIDSQCHQHEPDWNIDTNRLATFDTVLFNANTAYQANSDKATKNAITVANKNAAFGELKHNMGTFINYLELNTQVPDAALEAMGLRPRQHHAHLPLPRPAEQLVLSVKKQHDEITVYAARPEQDQPTAGVGPAHYHGFALRYRVEGENEVEKTVISTRLHHTLFFERTDEGKRVFLSAAWVNPRLEEGPWSGEISEIIG
ncbi:MAG: hypothetical protein LBF82_00850 [Lactobacillales bacterium]|jgi:hypothetical protein|nr:hypothetical protein [Lactobacillales bacterium]